MAQVRDCHQHVRCALPGTCFSCQQELLVACASDLHGAQQCRHLLRERRKCQHSPNHCLLPHATVRSREPRRHDFAATWRDVHVRVPRTATGIRRAGDRVQVHTRGQGQCPHVSRSRKRNASILHRFCSHGWKVVRLCKPSGCFHFLAQSIDCVCKYVRVCGVRDTSLKKLFGTELTSPRTKQLQRKGGRLRVPSLQSIRHTISFSATPIKRRSLERLSRWFGGWT